MKQVKLSAERRALFLDELARHGIVIRAARAASPHAAPRSALRTFYHARNRDPEFAEAWDNAIATASSVVESELHRRAVEGYEEPVYQRGEKVGTVRRYSDRLLELRAKALLPHYRERPADINVTATAQAAAGARMDMEATIAQLDDEGRAAMRVLAMKALAQRSDLTPDDRRELEIAADHRALYEQRRTLAARTMADAERSRPAPPIIDVTPEPTPAAQEPVPSLGEERAAPAPEAPEEPPLPSNVVPLLAPRLFRSDD